MIAPLAYKAGAWVGAGKDTLARYRPSYGTRLVADHRGRPVVLAEDPFSIRYLQRLEPGLQLRPFTEDLFAPAG